MHAKEKEYGLKDIPVQMSLRERQSLLCSSRESRSLLIDVMAFGDGLPRLLVVEVL